MTAACATKRWLVMAFAAIAAFLPFGAVCAAGATPVPVSDQQAATDAFDRQLAAQVQAVLDRVTGPGHALVEVNAQLDFSSVASDEQVYVHASSVPPVAAGVIEQGYSAMNGTGRVTSRTVDNALGVLRRTVNAPPGRVQRLHVVVLLDRTRTTTAPSLPPLTSMVKAAVGYSARRGDTVSVQLTSFPSASATRSASAAAPAAKPGTWNVVTIAGAGLIGALLVALFVVNRRRPRRA